MIVIIIALLFDAFWSWYLIRTYSWYLGLLCNFLSLMAGAFALLDRLILFSPDLIAYLIISNNFRNLFDISLLCHCNSDRYDKGGSTGKLYQSGRQGGRSLCFCNDSFLEVQNILTSTPGDWTSRPCIPCISGGPRHPQNTICASMLSIAGTGRAVGHFCLRRTPILGTDYRSQTMTCR